MIDSVRIERITRLKDRVVKDFDHGDWAMLAIYLGDKGKIINAHSRLLRSLSWGDDDYPACVAEVLGQLISNDESVIDLVESMLDDKQGNAGIDSRNDVVSELVLDISSAKDLDVTLASAMMPFHASFVDVREAMRSACSNCGLKLKAADETWENPILIQDIFDLITRSCIVIVDFTGKNPNVMYETGIAHALGKEVIPVTQDISDVPFDLKHHRVLQYDSNESGRERLRQSLESRMRTILRQHGWLLNLI